MRPLHLAPNLIDHFYLGGSRIAALRGITTTSGHQPEEWVGATVARADHGQTGLARTVDGDLVRDLVVADPLGWTGGGGSGPGDTGVLLKLLDAGQRLPVHVHPDRAFAARHLDCPYGKTEAWYVLSADPGAQVHVGWSVDVDPAELAVRRDAQDSAWLLDHLHAVPVRAGDAVLVPAGTPHAIGAGVFVAEVQEPTDFSILLEWSVTTSTREESHLGLGFDAVMPAVDHHRLSDDDLAALVRHVGPEDRSDAPRSCLPAHAEELLRLDVLAPVSAEARVGAGFAAVVVLDGEGELVWDGGTLPLRRGDALVVPAGVGGWGVRGPVRAVVARPGTRRPGA